MARKTNNPPQTTVSKGPFAALIACSGVCIVLAFMFGMMVGDGGAANKTASNNTTANTPSQTAFGNDGPNALPVPSTAASSPSRPPVQVSPGPTIELGSLPVSTQVPVEAQLINTGDQPLTIRTSRANCGCTTVDMAGTVIEPGGSTPLKATFNSQNNPGPRTATITVMFEGYDQPISVNVSANVTG
jgi:hypothetical protein